MANSDGHDDGTLGTSTTLAPIGDREPVPSAAVLAALADLGFDAGTPRAVSRTVLDSVDGRLHRAGLRLELVEGPGRELVLSGTGSPPAHVAVSAAPRFADDLPRGPLRHRLAALLDVRALLPVVAVVGRRTVASRRDGEGKVVAGAVLTERANALAPGRDPVELATWHLTIVPTAGHGRPAARAVDAVLALGAERRSGDVVDVAVADLGLDLRGTSGSPTIPLDPDARAIDGFVAVLDHLAGTIAETWQGTIDDVDPEFLHDLRVAVRRTRSVISQGRHVLPEHVRDRWREQFGGLGSATGPARDLDVLVIEWATNAGPLAVTAAAELAPVRAHLDREREAAHEALAAELASDRAVGLLQEWRAWLAGAGHGEGDLGPDSQATDRLGTVVAERITKAQRRVLRDGRAIGPETPGEVLHDLRKDAKKLRYLIECFGGLFEPAARKTFVQRLKALQDNLGEHQDAEVHVDHLRSLSQRLAAEGAGPATLLAIGQLTERLDQRRQAARDEFAQRFADYDTKPTRRALDDLLGPIR